MDELGEASSLLPDEARGGNSDASERSERPRAWKKPIVLALFAGMAFAGTINYGVRKHHGKKTAGFPENAKAKAYRAPTQLDEKAGFNSKGFAYTIRAPKFTTASTGDDDDGTAGTNVTMRMRVFADEGDCQNRTASLMNSYHDETFTLGVCSWYKSYNDTASEGEVAEYLAYKATCSDGWLTVTKYRDEDCSEEAATPADVATSYDSESYEAGIDHCVHMDGGGVMRLWVDSCDGSVDAAAKEAWDSYDYTSKDEFNYLIETLDKQGLFSDQKAKALGLTPSDVAVRQSKRLMKKIKETKHMKVDMNGVEHEVDTMHPILKRVSTSPHTWELVKRMHEGTLESREAYKQQHQQQQQQQQQGASEGGGSSSSSMALFHPEFDKQQGMKGMVEAHKETMGLLVYEQIQFEKSHEDKKADEETQKKIWWWFYDDEDDGDDVAEQLVDDKWDDGWDDQQYEDKLPAITLHAGVNTGILWWLGTATVDIAVDLDLMYSAGYTTGEGTTTDWTLATVEYTSSCTFMWDICDNPGDSIAFGVEVGASLYGISASLQVTTIWSDPAYELIGVEFGFDIGFDADTPEVMLTIELLWCTTHMEINTRDMRAYCNPLEYKGIVAKDEPWTLTGWVDDAGWHQSIGTDVEEETDKKEVKQNMKLLPKGK